MSTSRIAQPDARSPTVDLQSVPEPPERPDVRLAADATAGSPAAGRFSPAVARPLDGAFQTSSPRSMLVTARLNEDTEREVLARGGPRLVAYGQFDPARRPVVLVHGINGSGSLLTALADKLTAAGRQVYVYQFDDFGSMATSGAHLAREIRHLWRTTPHHAEPLEVVGHSMGGIIGRLALNHLEESGTPRGGFPSARLHMLDTSLDGGWHEPSWMPFRGAFLGLMRFLGFGAFVDMRGSSAMFEGLYATQLPNVVIDNLVARDPRGGESNTRNLHSLSDADRSAIAAYLAHGTIPSEPRLRNFGRGLEQDVRGEALRERLRHELLTREPAEAMRVAYDAIIPQLVIEHNALVADGDSPAVARLVSLLGDSPQPNVRDL